MRYSCMIAACIVVLGCTAAVGQPRATESFQTRFAQGQAAFGAKRYDEAGRDFLAALHLAPQQIGLVYKLATVAYAEHNRKSALYWLRRYVAMGVHGQHDLEHDFPSLKTSSGFPGIVHQFAASATPFCPCRTAYLGGGAPFLAEGIAFDRKRGRLLVAGVYNRTIVAVANGRQAKFIPVLPDGLSPLGITIDDAHDLLWVAGASLPQSQGATHRQQRHSALLAYDLATGTLRASYPVPGEHNLKSVAIAPDGTIYVTDADGALFRLARHAKVLDRLTDAKSLVSPEGIVIGAHSRYALVADYVLGLLRIDLASGAVRSVAVPPTVTTLGIDGLAALPRDGFVATQNGLGPMRIVQFHLSPGWSRLTRFKTVARGAPEISDLSQIVVSGNSIFVVGVSQWASCADDSGTATKPVSQWRIVQLAGVYRNLGPLTL